MSTDPNLNPGEELPETPPLPDIPVEIAPLSATPPPTVSPPSASVPGGPVSKENRDKKVIAGVLGIVLGVFGVHKFYLGYQTEGIIMLVASLVGWFLCGIPTAAVAIVGLIEGILYLTKPDEEFVVTYVTGRKPWF